MSFNCSEKGYSTILETIEKSKSFLETEIRKLNKKFISFFQKKYYLKKKREIFHFPLMNEITSHPSEIEARLCGITVYALVDRKTAFVSITGDSGKSFCPIFFNKETAMSYHSKLETEAPHMVEKTHVIEAGLDDVLKHVTHVNAATAEPTKLVFRLIPDPKQVENALQILRTSKESETRPFLCLEGVPIFLARSLEVNHASVATKTTPFFFNKEDADLAILSAHHTKKTIVDMPSANSEKTLRSTEKKFNYSYEHQNDLKVNVEEKSNCIDNVPLIEVGCLEWVIQQMIEDRKGNWTQVVFIPPGFMKTTS